MIAAGGIADGKGMAAGFMLGADAVQVGTRFIVATESNAHQNYKDKVLKAKDISTVVSASHFGHAVRAIKNQLTKDFEQAELAAFKQEDPDLIKRISKLPLRARTGRKSKFIPGSTIVFIRNKRRDSFTFVSEDGSIEELTFLEAVKEFERLANIKEAVIRYITVAE